MRVHVEYSVPVLVEVDLDDETVVAVTVDDEEVEGSTTVVGLEGGSVSARAASTALRIAEEQSWPAWEFGL
jgi:aspartyl aminopeptidase